MKELKYEAAGDAGAWFELALMTTLRWEGTARVRARVREMRRREGNVIYAFWHGQLLMPAYWGRHLGVRIMISQSEDGEYIARVVKRLGFGVVRGSATRGGAQALRELVRASKGDLAVTPDGPQGPRHEVQPGTILLAQMTGLPIWPIAGAARRCVRMNSWDRFEVPLPGTRAAFVLGELMQVDPEAKGEKRQKLCGVLKGKLMELTNRARRMVGLGPEDGSM